MTNSNHTKGPIIIDERNGIFLLTADRSATDVEAVGIAYKMEDAALFAAAPDLLEALQLCVIRDPSLKDNAMVMQALAKAGAA